MPATKTAIRVQLEANRNLVRILYLGHVTAADMTVGVKEVERLLLQMKPGFTVLGDLSGLESMDLACVPQVTRMMDLCRVAGIGTVVRVVPDPTKDIGFNILAIIHYRRGVKIITCATLAEAERVLKV